MMVLWLHHYPLSIMLWLYNDGGVVGLWARWLHYDGGADGNNSMRRGKELLQAFVCFKCQPIN
jgi:hypothetical protein